MALIKCPECGKEISDQAKACIHCGYPLETNIDESVLESYEQKQDDGQTSIETNDKVSFGEKIKAKISGAWNRLGAFYKISLIALVVIIILFVVAYCVDKKFAIVCAVVQFIGVIVAQGDYQDR